MNALRGIHWGQRAWLVCSGKGLEATDPRRLTGEVTFGFNGIFLAGLGFHPTYLCVEDELVAEDFAPDINCYGAATKFVAHDCRRFGINGNNTRFPRFLQRGADWTQHEWPAWGFDAVREISWGGTVSYMAMQLAYYMGVRRLYVIGCPGYPPVPAEHKREARGAIRSTGADPFHAGTGYFTEGKRYHNPCEPRMKKAHAKALAVFRAAGGEIVNCTPDSTWGVFPEAPYDEVLRDAG